MSLEANLKSITEIAKQKAKENSAFKSYLKVQSVQEIDTIVQTLNDKVTPQIDCTDCGNCCANLRPAATRETLINFVKEEEIDKYMYAESMECKNLIDKRCTVYSNRPDECKSFPYMDRKNFVNRTTGTFQNYEICPIVFNIVEALKTELKWSYK